MHKQIIPLVVGLAVGLAALKLGYDYLAGLKKANEGATVPMKTVLVAARNLPVATNLTAQDVKVVKMPVALTPAGVYTEPGPVVGKSLRVSVAEGMPLHESLIAGGKGFGGVIPPGYLAVSVKVDEYTGVAGFLQPGDRVAVMGTFRVHKNNRDETVSKIILHNVEVRAVGQQYQESAGQNGVEANLVRSVTLLVKPEEAERLQLASSSGKIYLAMHALRNAGREGTTNGVTLTKLLGGPEDLSHSLNVSSLVDGFFTTLSKTQKFLDSAAAKSARAPAAATPGKKPVKEPYVVELIYSDRVEQIYFESPYSDRKVDPGKSSALKTDPGVRVSGL